MTIEIGIVITIVLGVLITLATTKIATDAVLAAALTALLALPVPIDGGWKFGIISIGDALRGFGNEGMLTVGVMYIIVAGLRETGGVDWIAANLLGKPKGERAAILRVFAPICGMSVFLNNTPVVAMFIPAVQDWAKRLKLPPSKLMIPISYAAILGGVCSLIGTSTNLVVNALVIGSGRESLGMFDITWIGVPAAIVGGTYLVLLGPKLLPSRRGTDASLADAREYAMELVIPAGSPVAGKTVEQAGLRSLPGCFLVEVEREGDTLSAVGPDQVLHAGDRLLFVGVVESIRDLANTRGLAPATDQVFKLDSPRFRRRLFEAVVAPGSPMAGDTIRGVQFRSRYNGAVIAVARNGERLTGKLGDIRLEGGDLLLVEADRDFADRVGRTRDFLLVRKLDDSTPRRHDRALLALGILAAVVGLATFEVYPMLICALLGAGAMVASRCCTIVEARTSIDWSVLIVIGCALGLGQALDQSGAAKLVADSVLSVAGTNPLIALIAIYAVTSFLTEIISNSACVALVFPIAQATAASLGVDFMPFILAIMAAGSASFATPLGYQTNLMVAGPGGYTLTDFLRIGVPMNIIVGIATITAIAVFYPF